jgi:hypothetical protein
LKTELAVAIPITESIGPLEPKACEEFVPEESFTSLSETLDQNFEPLAEQPLSDDPENSFE